MVIRSLMKSVIAACVLAVAATNADAGVKLTYGSPVSISAGGSSYIDVFVESDTAIYFDQFTAEFVINPSSSSSAVAGGVQFGVQNESQLGLSNYVHFGRSLGSPIGLVSGVNNETYVGGDGTLDGLGTLLSTSKLLFRLDLIALASVLEGDEYTISLVRDSFIALDPNSDPLAIDNESYDNFGLITVAAPVPEPGSAVVFAVVAGLTAIQRGVRRFRVQKKS